MDQESIRYVLSAGKLKLKIDLVLPHLKCYFMSRNLGIMHLIDLNLLYTFNWESVLPLVRGAHPFVPEL